MAGTKFRVFLLTLRHTTKDWKYHLSKSEKYD